MFPRSNTQLKKFCMNPDMHNKFVLNASPLIVLGKADLLRTIAPLAFEWVIPNGVAEEIEKKRPLNLYIVDLQAGSSVVVERCAQIHSHVAAWDLGQGESEVLSITLQKGVSGTAVLDDLQARKCAKILETGLIGSVGLLLLAKRCGLIQAVKPAMNKIIEAGLYISPDVLASVYKRIGE